VFEASDAELTETDILEMRGEAKAQFEENFSAFIDNLNEYFDDVETTDLKESGSAKASGLKEF
jgi:hypothetical protein